MIRRSLPETLHRPASGVQEKVAWRPYVPLAFTGVAVLAAATIGTYVRAYVTTYAIVALRMPKSVAFAATIVVGVTASIFAPTGGILSDRFGRKPVMLLFGTLSMLSIVPSFYLINHYRSTAVLLSATAFLGAFATLAIAPITAWLTESLFGRDPLRRIRPHVRSRHRHLRRQHAIPHHLADESDRKQHGSGVVLDRRSRDRSPRDVGDQGVGALQACSGTLEPNASYVDGEQRASSPISESDLSGDQVPKALTTEDTESTEDMRDTLEMEPRASSPVNPEAI